MFAVADVLAEEYRHIVDAGILVQVDDAVLMHEADSVLASGGSFADYRRWAQLRVDALNHACAGCRASASATTSAGAAGTVPTPTTRRSPTSSTSCSASRPATT